VSFLSPENERINIAVLDCAKINKERIYGGKASQQNSEDRRDWLNEIN
jgi:hypothetical protein